MIRNIKIASGHLFLAAILLLFFSNGAFAKEKQQRAMSFNKPGVNQSTRTIVEIGAWTYWMQWNAESGRNPITGDSGGFFPKASPSTIFADGLIWGGIVDDPSAEFKLRAGGSTYISGVVPGYISNGSRVTSDQDSKIRIYRIRADFQTVTDNAIKADAAVQNAVEPNSVTEDQLKTIRDQYKADWQEWPVELGAPFEDVDDDGVYNPVTDPETGLISRDGDHPGIANADQVVWTVTNDFSSSETNEFLGSPPMGIEYQITAWAYNQPGAALGKIIFKKYTFINKSQFRIDSMYVCQWSDPDLGDFGEDVVGCDSVLSLGYVFNGNPVDGAFDALGMPPPAAGYDFFQGPLVAGILGQDLNHNGDDDASETGIFNLKETDVGFINLPMTSFGYFAAGDPVLTDPPLGTYDGTRGWYNLLRGFWPTPDVDNPTSYSHRDGALAGRTTKFPLNGDPEEGILGGNADLDIDGRGGNLAPADRRLLLSSGPFVMQPGDVQEVVVALIGETGGTDSGDPEAYLKAVTQLKATDSLAQNLYDDLFTTVPKPPVPPSTEAIPFETKIVLNWGTDLAQVAKTETDDPKTGYNFEGYNVYQLPTETSTIAEGLRIATFDKVNGVTTIMGKRLIAETGLVELVAVQQGTDNGVKRHFTVDRNFLTGEPLFTGNTYFFAVTAYNFNDFSVIPPIIEAATLESGSPVIAAIPQTPNPGVVYGSEPDAEFTVAHDAGGSDGIVKVISIDPNAQTGHNYEVFFETIATVDTTTSDTTTELMWNVRDVTAGSVVFDDFQTIVADVDAANDQPIFDGIQVKVSGPPLTVNDWDWTDTGDVSPLYPDYARGRWISGANWGGGALFGGLGMAHIFWGEAPGVDAAAFPAIEFHFTHMLTYEDLDGNGEHTLKWGPNFESEPYTFDTAQGQKAFMYETWTTGSGNFVGFNDIPFTVWDVDDPNNPRQLNVVIRDRDTNGRWDIGDGNGPYNYVWILADDYDPSGQAWDPVNGPDQDFFNILLSGPVPAYYVLWGVQRGSREFLARDGILTLIPNRVITAADMFSFASSSTTFSEAAAKQDAEKINVFPNPYYAFNPAEQNRFDRFVTFNHLPAQATLRIFNLAGDQVRKLDKNGEGQFLRWDLRNESNLPVASGLYIVHINLPDLSMEKVLKVYIIQGQEILEFF